AIEADDGNPELRRRARGVMEEWRGLIQRTVARGIERGEVRADADGDALATLMIALLEGGIMMTNLYGDPVHLLRAVDHLDGHIARQVAAPAPAGTGA
ncbi:MAG TPA: TetR/AcrR family transcriptional regulator C-terminal ligand-binding domain-containing protein, partial [Longimicrobiaceae bacterium]|nr:TetR/AcrR family transcriptional regulator C-terminal ligand-binding domain-containing protein [Longimicrobiaceae bacterium]